jgi:ATP-dependent DNA helicase RecQ
MPRTLPQILAEVFGHAAFRPHQQVVCEAAAAGRDVLLVMPTGAGKSLCYQLPALARGGTALVISPLIALMDDQAHKLSALGLNVARIHSGLPRDDARQACRDYLAGALDFLFIAPERMRVPGFPEMLAKRKPALVAIDEAHCISQWGHDFRPDYRTLGQHLPALRPAPIVALTATATPDVRRDIVAQLQLADPAIFVTGFRRDNLAVEVVELSKPQRNSFTADLLSDEGARPAIVYAPSRKAAEELATLLDAKFPARAYHAGLPPQVRERVQREFLDGSVSVVVATIAFGMGVDKADVRTVVHTALPASVEGFYQEIGRAGRDGEPSRSYLLHSFADRRMHEFFLERDYPATDELDRVARALPDEFVPGEDIARRLRMSTEDFARALDKLLSHGVAVEDMAGNVCRGDAKNWRGDYERQVSFRREQAGRMAAFAEGAQCRMAALVRHFGDTADGGRVCGRCDVCAPEGARGQSFVPPDDTQRRALQAILRAADGGRGKSVGKLFTDLALTQDRGEFDAWLDGLQRAGLLAVSTDNFRNDEGKDISFKRAVTTFDGKTADAAAMATVMLRQAQPRAGSKPRKARNAKSATTAEIALDPAGLAAEEALRKWRKELSSAAGKPAFLVLSDAALLAIAHAQPVNLHELGTVRGMGPQKLEQFGADILRCVREAAAVTA